MWAFDTREIPAAESGRTYGSVEERCRACVVNGGDEGMCISDAASSRMLQTIGRPCPRVEIDPENVEAMSLMGWLIHDDLKPLAPEYARALLAGRPADDRARLLSRVASALRSKELSDRLHPDPVKEA